MHGNTQKNAGGFKILENLKNTDSCSEQNWECKTFHFFWIPGLFIIKMLLCIHGLIVHVFKSNIICLWLCWVLIAVWAFLQLWRPRAALVVMMLRLLTVAASHLVEHRLVSSWARGLSGCGSWALEHKISSCGTRASWLHGMWNLPRSEVKSVSPTWTGGFFTT